MRYLNSDKAKRPRPFYIGVSTVFILVTVITMFKAIIEVAPILFVRIGQEQVGAVDYTITSKNKSMIPGDINQYNIDPWNNPVEVISDKDEPVHNLGVKDIEVWSDHISIEGKINIIRVPYFFSRLDELPSFDGFVARWYLPGESLQFPATNTTAIITIMIIDTAHEIKVGVGYDWKPVILGSDEMQISEGIQDLMGANYGDQISVPLDFSGYFGVNAKTKLFAVMIIGH